MHQIKNRKRRRYAVPIGGIFVVLAVAGALAVVILSLNLTFTALDNSGEKDRLGQIIRPVMMFDPAPFESPADIDPQQMLLYCMWATLMSDKRDKYTYDENAELIIPAADLEASAARLFGSDTKLQHKTFNDYSDYQTIYYYDSERKIYNVPTSAQLYVYTPEVQKIERANGDVYNVTVAYIPPVNAWTADFSGNKGMPDPDKIMVYVMKKNGSNYQILALRDTVIAEQAHGAGLVSGETAG